MTTPQTARARHLQDSPGVAKERFFATFRLAPAGTAHVGPDGRWRRVNRRLREIPADERDGLLGLRVLDLAAAPDQALRTVAGEQPACPIEKRCIRKDGTSPCTGGRREQPLENRCTWWP